MYSEDGSTQLLDVSPATIIAQTLGVRERPDLIKIHYGPRFHRQWESDRLMCNCYGRRAFENAPNQWENLILVRPIGEMCSDLRV